MCRGSGLLTAPRSPTKTGKIERFHKTLRAEFLREGVRIDLRRPGSARRLGKDIQHRTRSRKDALVARLTCAPIKYERAA